MKKEAVMISMMGVLLCGALFVQTPDAQAKKKPYSLKGTTLTVSGKISWSTKLPKAKKIKKIVVKKGVKKLPEKPFRSCKKVKKLQVPGNLTFWTRYGGWKGAENVYAYAYPNKVDAVEFTTALPNQYALENFGTKKYIVSKKDKKFKSIAGNVYDKSGKKFLAMPSETKTLKIADGCETVYTYGFCYRLTNNDPSADDSGEMPYSDCKKLKEVYVPASVKKYVGMGLWQWNETAIHAKYFLSNTLLDFDSVNELCYLVGVDNIASVLKDRVEKVGDFLLYNKEYLLLYTGSAEEITIPEGVKNSRTSALSENDATSYHNIKKVNLPKSYEGKLCDIWEPSDATKENINKMEIVICNKPSATFEYTKDVAGQYVKLTADEDGYMCVGDAPLAATFFDADKKPLSLKTYENENRNFIKYVKKGETLYAKVPEKAYSSNLNGVFSNLEICPVNAKTLVCSWERENVAINIMQGTGAKMYSSFSLKKRRYLDIAIQLYKTGNSGVEWNLQKKEKNKWVNVTTNKVAKTKEMSLCLVLNSGEYRVVTKAGAGVLFDIAVYEETSQRCDTVAKTKKTAKQVINFDGGFAYEDGKTAWFAFSNKSKKKTKKITLRACPKLNASPKLTVTLYKKGTKKAIQKKTIQMTYNNRDLEFVAKMKKGTYYIKVTRNSIQVPCFFTLG